jgi:hypothetical protein
MDPGPNPWGRTVPTEGPEDWHTLRSRSVLGPGLGDFSPLSSRHSAQWGREGEGESPRGRIAEISLGVADEWREEVLFCILDCLQAMKSSKEHIDMKAMQDMVRATHPVSLAGRLTRYANRLANSPNAAQKDGQTAFLVLFTRVQRAPWMTGPGAEGGVPSIALKSSTEGARLQSTRAPNTLLTAADATTAYDVPESRTGRGTDRGVVGLGDLTGDDVTFDFKYSPESPLRTSSASHSLTFSASTSVHNSMSQPKDYRSSFFSSDMQSSDEKEIMRHSSPSRLNSASRTASPHWSSPSSLAADKGYHPNATNASPSASASTSPFTSSARRTYSGAQEALGPRSMPPTFEDLYSPYVQGSVDKDTFQDENPYSNRLRLDNSIKSAARTIGGSRSSGKILAVNAPNIEGHVSMIRSIDDALNLCTGSRSGPGSGPGSGSGYSMPSNRAGPWTQKSLAAKVASPVRQGQGKENEEDYSALNESSQTQFWMLSDSDSGDELDCMYGDTEGTCLFDDSG